MFLQLHLGRRISQRNLNTVFAFSCAGLFVIVLSLLLSLLYVKWNEAHYKSEIKVYASYAGKAQARIDFESGIRRIYIISNETNAAVNTGEINELFEIETWARLEDGVYSIGSDSFVYSYNSQMEYLVTGTE